MFNADRKAIGGVMEEVHLQWPCKYPEQMEKDAIASIGEGPFSSVIRGQGRREAETGSFGSLWVGSWANSYLIVSIFFVEQEGRLSSELEEWNKSN